MEPTTDVVDEAPPRDNLVRVSQPFEMDRTTPDGMPVLHGMGAVYNEWTEINSRYEGHFMERFAPGSFARSIDQHRDRIRCLFHHGQDPSIGYKPLGILSGLEETDRALEYDCDLFPADYVRALVPGLEAGVYGSSFKFSTVRKDDVAGRKASNGKGLLERTIREASIRELGPTPFPAYSGTTAGLRSITDTFVLGAFPAEELVAEASQRGADRDLVAEMKELARLFALSHDEDHEAMRSIVSLLDEITGTTPAPSEDVAPAGTSSPSVAPSTSTGLYGLDRGRKGAEPWRL